MKKYEIQLRNVVKKDIEQIKDFIVEKTSRENAERYAAELYAEMLSLTFLADSIKVTEWKTAKKYSKSKKEKVLLTSNGKWSIFSIPIENMLSSTRFWLRNWSRNKYGKHHQ